MSTQKVSFTPSMGRRTVVVAALGAALVGSVAISAMAEAAAPLSGDTRATAVAGSINACPAGSTQLLSAPDAGSASNELVTAVVPRNGQLLDLSLASSLTGAGLVAYVKAANAYNVYVITVGTTDTTKLHGPLNGRGAIPAVSHYLVCQTTAPPPPPPLFGDAPEIYLGYADDFHGVANTHPFKPSPWKGDPGVTYIGCDGALECGGAMSGKFDSGAIRIDNVDVDTPLTLKTATVDIGPCHFDPWSGPGLLLPATAPPGEKLVLAQSGVLGKPLPPPCNAAVGEIFHVESNFDTSERPGDVNAGAGSYDCNPAERLTPVITLTFESGAAGPAGDVTLTINDTARILNTGGTDRFACPDPVLGNHEASPWTGPVFSSL